MYVRSIFNLFFSLNCLDFMNNNFESVENQDFELDQKKQLNDYQILIERFQSIKKAIVSLEDILNK